LFNDYYERIHKHFNRGYPLPIPFAYAAEIAYNLGQMEKSDSLIALCLQTLDEVKEPAALSESKEVIAGIYKKQEKFEEALLLFDESVEDLEEGEQTLLSKELFEMMEKYEQSKFGPSDSKNSNNLIWLLLGLIPFAVALFFLFRKKSQPEEPTSHTLKIAWKDEALLEKQDPFLKRFVEIIRNDMEMEIFRSMEFLSKCVSVEFNFSKKSKPLWGNLLLRSFVKLG